VFLRMAEDRGLEPSKQLLKLCGQNDIYSHFMRNVCRKADDKYNSGLFHFQKEEGVPEDPDRITPKVEVDDKVFKTILQSLYSEHGSPYDFRVMPLEILGTIYERFLGKVIRLTAGHRAQVEEKPDVRKAGGVHYTPPYIAGYTIKQTIGRQIEGRGPAQLAGGKGKPLLRILDPACGSGTFLLGAYQYLLDYYLKWYSEHQPENYKKAVYKDEQSGEWRLIIEEKKRILTTHIFGVDIDRQAVEVTKLSLLLKVLEGESEQTISQQLRLFHERALPNLVNNIKCGNSLIGSDYNKNNLIPDADSEELKRINPLDWKQGFPDAMKAGGFGCIIGNPPWGGDIDRWLLYFHEKYPATTQEHTDSFKLFIERAVCLLPFAGLVAMIVPNTILRQRRLKDIRALLLQHKILSLVDLGEDVFQGVVAPSCIFVVERNEPTPLHEVAVANLALLSNAEKATVLESGISNGTSIRQTEFQRNPDLDFAEGPRQYRVPTLLLGGCKELECKDAGINYQRVGTGMQDKGKSDLADRLLYEGERQHPGDKMYWKGADMNRFWIADSTTRFCRPNYKKFVLPNEVVRLNERVYDRVPKILFRQTADRLIAAIDYRGIWFGRSIIAILVRSGFAHEAAYFLGILNSKYLRWVYNNLAHEGGRVFAQVKLAKVKQLPIRTINFSDAADKAAHDQMVGLVDSMQTLHKQLAAIDSESGKAVIQRQIESTDAEIDQLVYNLYGLTAEEIEIVENSTAKGV
jgi:type I restriction-modification system DNA methylase subunit